MPRPAPNLVAAKLAEIERRYRRPRKRRTSPRQIVALRLADLARLLRSRHGTTLPDSAVGRDAIEPVLHHIASMPRPTERCTHWLDIWAPWLTGTERNAIVARALFNARNWTADQLAWRYRLTLAERAALGLTTIGAIDCNKAARLKARKARARARTKLWKIKRKNRVRSIRGYMLYTLLLFCLHNLPLPVHANQPKTPHSRK